MIPISRNPFKTKNKKGVETIKKVDKLTRVMDNVPYIAGGLVYLPMGSTKYTNGTWVLDYVSEHSSFTPDDTHDFDDQVDVTMDAIDLLLAGKGTVDYRSLSQK